MPKKRKLSSWKILDAADTEDSAWHWAYKCVTCVKEAQKFDTDGQAWAYILEVSGTAARKQAKVARFQTARTKMLNTFTARTKMLNTFTAHSQVPHDRL
jgi:hypothetical protein